MKGYRFLLICLILHSTHVFVSASYVLHLVDSLFWMAIMKLKVALELGKNPQRRQNSLGFELWPPDSKHSAIPMKILSDVVCFFVLFRGICSMEF